MPNRLQKLKVNFVSLVDKPANQSAVHVLAKRDAPEQTPKESAPVSHAAVATPTVADQPAAITKADMEAAIAEAIRKSGEAYEAKLTEANTKVEKLNKDLEETTARAQTAEQVAKAEQEARETTTAIAKAAKEMPSLPGTTPEEIGPLLRLVSKALPAEDFAKLETILKAASVAVAKGDLFKENGSSYPTNANGSQSAEAKLQDVAKQLREADPTLTPAKAIAKAMETRPDLVQLDRVEKGFAKA